MEDYIKNIQPTRKVLFEKAGQMSKASEYLIDVLEYLNKTELIKEKDTMVSSNLINMSPQEFAEHLRVSNYNIDDDKKTCVETFNQFYYDNSGKIIIWLNMTSINNICRSSLIEIHYEFYRFLKTMELNNLTDYELYKQIQIGAAKFFENKVKNIDVKEVYQEKHWDEAEVKIKEGMASGV